MKKSYKSLYKGGEGEIMEKKSRFLAVTAPVKNEQEALNFIEIKKKEHWNASHNCYAYIIGSNQELQRCSDDGEPSGTAGRPMLDVLLGQEVNNCVVVVTRYFGGTLLGTGGLVRAYSKAVQAGLEKSTVIEQIYGSQLELVTDYQKIGKIQYLLGGKNIAILHSEYGEEVTLSIVVPGEELEQVKKDLLEVTNGSIQMECKQALYFAVHENKVLLFEEEN